MAADQEHRSISNMVEVMIRDYCGRAGVEIAERAAMVAARNQPRVANEHARDTSTEK